MLDLLNRKINNIKVSKQKTRASSGYDGMLFLRLMLR